MVRGTGVSGATAPLIHDRETGSKLLPTPQLAVLSVPGAQEIISIGINKSRYVFTCVDPREATFSYRNFFFVLNEIIEIRVNRFAVFYVTIKSKMKKIVLLILFFSLETFAEELVVIRAVSSTKKSFVLPLGTQHGVSLGQESLFTTENLSVIATAKEVTRNESLWELNDKDAMVPFRIDQFVSFSNNLESLLHEIPLIKYKEKEVVYLGKNTWFFRLGYYGTLNETVSSVNANQILSSSGLGLDGMYLMDISKKINVGVGLRYDTDNSQNSDPPLAVPTNRLLVQGEIQYKFDPFKGTTNYFYGTLDLGLGMASSNVSGISSSGLGLLLPGIRFGINFSLSSKNSLVTELALENLLSLQTFDDGTQQDTSELDLKLSLGFKF